MDIKQEQKLIQAAQQGNEAAFAELYDAYVDPVYRYIFFRVNSTETAQDLTAEVFLRIVESLPRYEDRGRPFLAWLYSIAHARVVDYYQETRRTGEMENIETLFLHADDDLDTGLMTTYRQQKVHAALRHLTEEQQLVITIRFLEGKTLQETADLLNKTVGAVKVAQFRALQTLSRALTEESTSLW